MSLFPSGTLLPDQTKPLQDTPQGPSWLTNPSFDSTHPHPSTTLSSSHSDSCSDDVESKPSKKKKKRSNKHKHSRVSPKPVKPNTVWLDECGLQPKDAFHVDPSPDRDNLTYERPYSGNVAVYKRRFRCVGLNLTQQRVELDDGRSKLNKKSKKKAKIARYYNTELTTSQEVIVSGPRSGNPLGDVLTFGEQPPVTSEGYVSQRVGEYNKSLMDDPHNVPLWLEFISSQDRLLDWEQLQDGKRKRAMDERKMAIYERALESNPTSVDLLLGHMSLAAKAWEPMRVIKEWKELVFRQPNVPRLWIGYIEFCENNFAEFTVDSVIALYCKCISTLCLIEEGTLQSHSPQPDSLQWMLTIFSMFCEFLRQSGHTERAVACYKALVEFNLCTPPHLNDTSMSSRLDTFKSFWESAVPKVGEAGAPGWKNWNSDAAILGPLTSDLFLTSDPENEDDDFELVSGLSMKEAWLRLEDHRNREHCLPWVGSEDPVDSERVVSFDNVKHTLFRLPDDELKLQLILRFLSFLGALTPTQHSQPTPHSSPSHTTPHTASSHLPSAEHVLEVSPHFVNVFGCLLSDSVCVSTGIGSTPPNLVFESIAQLIDSLSHTLLLTPTLTPLNPSVSNTITHLCHQALSLLPHTNAQTLVCKIWITHHLVGLASCLQEENSSKECRTRAKAVQKLIKNLLKLKLHRNNLDLWNCCAVVEHLLGHCSECVHVLETVLSSNLSASLCVTLVECAIGLLPSLVQAEDKSAGKKDYVLNTLLCLAEGKYDKDMMVTPVRILKAQTHFTSLSSHSTEIDRFHNGLCHIYLQYQTGGISAASKVFNELYQTTTQPSLLERLHLKHVRLLLHSPLASPKSLKSVLESALLTSPDHPWFLAKQLLIEEQSFSIGRIQTDKTFVSRIFGAMRELRRYARIVERGVAGDGTPVGSLRRALALLEKASEENRQSPLLWRLYMAIQALVDPVQVNSLFYRAIHACPWSKVLYEDAIRLLPESKLAEIIEVMEDKGLRLHTPLEEIQLILAD